MASSNDIPVNKGISVENESYDPVMKENYKKNATAGAKNQAIVYINRAGKTVATVNALITTNNTRNNNQETSPIDCVDIESIKGKFAWKLIAGHYVPCITRVIKGKHLMFVSVWMAENHLLRDYLHYLNADLYAPILVKSHFITDSEAKLLNEINQKHVDRVYGTKFFFEGQDYIVRLKDLYEFYTFIEICSGTLLNYNTPSRNEKCGFICINSHLIIPYCIKNGQKYVPLFDFGVEIENVLHRAVQLENYSFAYLKFCFEIQGIGNEYFASGSCTVICLDDIKYNYPPETNFKEYWPSQVLNENLLINRSGRVHPPGVWITPPEVVSPTVNNVIRTSTAPAPAVKPLNINIKRFTGNQMVNIYSAEAQPPSTSYIHLIADRHKIMATQLYSYNSRPTMSHGSYLINSNGYVVPPGNTVPAIGQLPQFFTQRVSNISQNYRQQFQPQRILRIQQQQIVFNRTLHQSVNCRLPNTQQPLNSLRNVRSIETAPASEIIDLTSPPTSPVPPTVQLGSPLSNFQWTLSRIPERPPTHDISYNAAYKIQKVKFQGRIIHCVNDRPYIYSELMVTLHDLIRIMFPRCTVECCAHVLKKYLKTTLFSGNSEQLALLRESGHVRSWYPDETPMALLNDISRVFVQLKAVLCRLYENIPEDSVVGVPSKKQRNN